MIKKTRADKATTESSFGTNRKFAIKSNSLTKQWSEVSNGTNLVPQNLEKLVVTQCKSATNSKKAAATQ